MFFQKNLFRLNLVGLTFVGYTLIGHTLVGYGGNLLESILREGYLVGRILVDRSKA
jgi:hypothetical protein